jgi:hypothetical protein
MTQQLDLDGMDVLVEFGDQLLARKGGSTGDLGFSFQNNILICRGMKPRGEVVVDPRPRKCSKSFSNIYGRIGTFVPPLLNTIIACKQTMLHLRRVISIKLIKLKFEAQRNRNSSVSIYAT